MTHHAASQDDLSISALFDFKSHVVLVTGGATGLGEMAAQGFVQNGARVFIASRKESELKKVGQISIASSFFSKKDNERDRTGVEILGDFAYLKTARDAVLSLKMN
jgi:NAD(P)-dependent dehydrogenase (short-subunit alcohol dehydrogenase family)